MTSQLALSFFGLTPDQAPEYRVGLFKQIHEIVFHGQGGYSWNEIYNMPRWLRLFTFKQIEDYYKDQKSQMDQASSKGSSTLVTPDGKVNKSLFPTTNPAKYK